MKKSFLYLIVSVLLASCGSVGSGELVGSYPREEWEQLNPYGMNYIHFGSFTMGPSDEDVPYALNNKVRKLLPFPLFTSTRPKFPITNTASSLTMSVTRSCATSWLMPMLKAISRKIVMTVVTGKFSLIKDMSSIGRNLLIWKTRMFLKTSTMSFTLQGADKFYDRKEIDTRKLKYRYWWIDYNSAAVKAGKDEEYGEVNSLNQLHSIRGHSDRSQFIIEEQINVYPDTLVLGA
jgi:sulfatase modifying factor 1